MLHKGVAPYYILNPEYTPPNLSRVEGPVWVSPYTDPTGRTFKCPSCHARICWLGYAPGLTVSTLHRYSTCPGIFVHRPSSTPGLGCSGYQACLSVELRNPSLGYDHREVEIGAFIALYCTLCHESKQETIARVARVRRLTALPILRLYTVCYECIANLPFSGETMDWVNIGKCVLEAGEIFWQLDNLELLRQGKEA